MADPVTIGAAVGWGVSAVGWVVSPIISKLLNKGFSYLSFDASEKLKELEAKVLQLELTLEAVEQSPHRDRLEKWLKELRSAFYEAEDILDDVEYYRLERQIVSQPDDKLESDAMPPRSSDWVKKLQAALPQSFQPKKQVGGTTTDDAPPDMSKMELKKILDKIENIINEAHKILQLLNLPSHSNVDKRQTVAAVTTAAPPPVVIGREKDRDTIIAMLHETVGDGQPESNSALSYSIIGIHGIPGSGKSTLAQYVCAREKNDKQEKKEGHFDLVMWIHVSQNFSVHTIFREMLEEATGNPSPEFKSLNTLEHKVEEALSGKRFLLVLDDVWYSKDVSRQQELQQVVSPLEVGKAGSKILVTSRTSDALLALGAVSCIPISDLDDNAFLKLFMHYALEGARIDDQNRRIFEMIGADIAKKLKRSPLAARTVGGQLRIRPKVEFWRSVRDRDLLNETRGALWWSYHHLDEQVRRCFAYCSIFPRRYLLKRDELVNLWVAEGFIGTTNTGEEMEAVGHGYLDELVSTSFLQLVGGGQDCYTIHDLLRDLVEKVAGSDCVRIESGWTGEVPRDVRHLFVETCSGEMITDRIVKLENLRTLVIYTDRSDTAIEEKVFEDMFMGLRTLRVLSVAHWNIDTLSFPASIGRLKHLRYLAIKAIHFRKLILPNTFTKLYHIQVLDFSFCRELVFYPGQVMVSNLINLRYISNISEQNLPNIIRLTSLQRLPIFRVRKEQGYELRQLRDLNKLRGRLGIHGLENVGGKEEALEANLAAKERLTRLDLTWDRNSCSADLEAEILEGLCPPMGLGGLGIHGYKGSRYPDWMVGNKNGPNYLQLLVLDNCSRLGAIPDRNEFFVHLRDLALERCSWDALPDNMEHLTSLKDLWILGCMNIRSLPTLPQSLECLSISHCNDVFTPNIGKLTSLQTLSSFGVKMEPGYELRQLKDLNKLRGSLGIFGLENVGGKEEAREANLAGKERITDLHLTWDWNRVQSCSADLEVEAEILEGLCPPMGLEKLVIINYKGSRYPDWMLGNKNGPEHLQQLELNICSPFAAIPDSNEFFLHLRGLALVDCNWDALPDNMEHLTSLKDLWISGCENIRSLPTLPQSLEYFKLSFCNDEFTWSCKTIGDPNWQKIEHVPNKFFEEW